MDGPLVVATRQEDFWRRFCAAMDQSELADDPQFSTNSLRVQNRTLLVPYLERLFMTRKVSEWLERLHAAEGTAAPLNNLDAAFAEPPVAERDMIVEYDHPEVGRVRLPGNPIKMSGVSDPISEPAPRLGEHTASVLREILSLSPDEITDLYRKRAVR